MESMTAEPDRQPLLAVLGACTHPGQLRAENQDNFLISDLAASDSNIVLRLPPGVEAATVAVTLSPDEHGALLLVADGMGGGAAGRLASGLACSFILAELQEGWRTDTDRTARRFAFRLGQAVAMTNRRIYEHACRNPELTGMGTTATVAGMLDDTVYIAQVGDSRAYLVREGAATQLTRDQSVVQQMVEAGALTLEEAERSEHGNLLLQALGVEATISVDLTSQQLRRGDCLLLCSDGLHRVVTAEEMAGVVNRIRQPDLACQELVALVNQRGAPDNVTVLAVRVAGTRLAAPCPDDLVGRMPLELPDDERGGAEP